MKCYGLLVTTLFTALLTGAVLHRAGWCSSAARAGALREVSRKTASARTAATSTPAPYHYRHGTPTHWHDCILQH